MSAQLIESNDNPLDRILKEVQDIAVLPQVVFKIMEGTASTDTSAATLEQSIQIDPGFSAKVLAMANSAYYALPKKVISIKEALAFLGFKTVRTIAVNAGVFDLFVGKNDRESLRRRAWWRHSLDTASCSKWLAGHFKPLNPEEAYTAGLIHLIGKTILDRSNPELYTTVMLAVEQGVPDRVAESHFFGCDHVEVSEGVCRQWGLPEDLVSAVAYGDPLPSDAPTHRACVALAHAMAHMANTGITDGDLVADIMPEWAVKSLNLGERLPEWIDAGLASITNLRPQL